MQPFSKKKPPKSSPASLLLLVLSSKIRLSTDFQCRRIGSGDASYEEKYGKKIYQLTVSKKALYQLSTGTSAIPTIFIPAAAVLLFRPLNSHLQFFLLFLSKKKSKNWALTLLRKPTKLKQAFRASAVLYKNFP